jgi:hypothetical protein
MTRRQKTDAGEAASTLHKTDEIVGQGHGFQSEGQDELAGIEAEWILLLVLPKVSGFP